MNPLQRLIDDLLVKNNELDGIILSMKAREAQLLKEI
jgi:hypothetical protein